MYFRLLFFVPLATMGLYGCGASVSAPEEEAWKVASSKATEAAFDTFLLQYPTSSYRSEAEKRIEGGLWEYAVSENTVYNYLHYRQRFPQGQNVSKIEEKLKAIPKDNLDFAALTSKTFAGIIRHNQQEIQVISLRFIQIEQSDASIKFLADINASGGVRKTVPGEIRTSDNGIVFQEGSTDPHILGLMEGRAYTRNNKMLLQSANADQYWSLK